MNKREALLIEGSKKSFPDFNRLEPSIAMGSDHDPRPGDCKPIWNHSVAGGPVRLSSRADSFSASTRPPVGQ